jgi:hypothetical protein
VKNDVNVQQEGTAAAETTHPENINVNISTDITMSFSFYHHSNNEEDTSAKQQYKGRWRDNNTTITGS